MNKNQKNLTKITSVIIVIIVISVIVSGIFFEDEDTYDPHRNVHFWGEESIAISINTNWSGNYYLYLPIMLDGQEPTELSKSIQFEEGNGSVEIIPIEMEFALNITAINNVSLSGFLEGNGNERYLGYTWTFTNGIDYWSSENILGFVSNETTDETILIEMEYRGNSNYCSRSTHITGNLNFNGSWSPLKYVHQAVCT